MAPAKRTKTAAAPAAKKAKVDTSVQAVQEIFSMASHLSPECQQMLSTSISSSIGVAVDERHEIQASVVHMMKEVVWAVITMREQEIINEEEKVNNCQSSKDALDLKVEEAKSLHIEAVESMKSKQAQVSDAKTDLAKVTVNFAEKEESQTRVDKDTAKAHADLKIFTDAVDVHLKALEEGLDESGMVQYEALQLAISMISIDESLTVALPSTVCKKVSDRGAFDKMVLNQLSASLCGKKQFFEAMVARCPQLAEERTRDVESAKTVLDSAYESKQSADAELAVAKLHLKQATSDLKDARAFASSCAPALQDAIGNRDEITQAFEDFKNFNVLCFQTMCERTSKPKEIIAEPFEEEPSVTDIETNAPIATEMEIEAPFETETESMVHISETIVETTTEIIGETPTNHGADAALETTKVIETLVSNITEVQVAGA